MIVGGVKRPNVVRARPKRTSSFQPPRPEVAVGRPRHVAPHPVARPRVVSRPPPAPPMRSTRSGPGRSFASPDAARDTVKALRTLRVLNPQTGHIRYAKKVQRYGSVEDWRFKAARAAQVRQTTDTIIDVRRAQGASAIDIANELVAGKQARIRNDFAINADRFKRRGIYQQQYGYGDQAKRAKAIAHGDMGGPGSALDKTLRSVRDSLLGFPAAATQIAKGAGELGFVARNLEHRLGIGGRGNTETPALDELVKQYEQSSVAYPAVRGAVRAVSHGDVGELKRGLETAHRHGAKDPLAYSEFIPALGAAGRVYNVAKHGSEAAATARAASYAGRAAGAGAKRSRAANVAARASVQSQRELKRVIALRKKGQATDAEVEAAARQAEQHAHAALPPKQATAIRQRRYSRSPVIRGVQKAHEAIQHRRGRDTGYKRGRAGKRLVKRASEGARRRAQSGGLGVETDVAQAIGKQKLANGALTFTNRKAQQLHNAAVRFSHTGEVLPGRELFDLREIRDTIDAHIKDAKRVNHPTETLERNRELVERLASDFARHRDDSHIAKARRVSDGARGSKALADALDEDLVRLGYITPEQAAFRRKAPRQFTHGNVVMGKRPDWREGVDENSLSSEDLKAMADNPDRSPGMRARASKAAESRLGLKRQKVRAAKREARSERLARARAAHPSAKEHLRRFDVYSRHSLREHERGNAAAAEAWSKRAEAEAKRMVAAERRPVAAPKGAVRESAPRPAAGVSAAAKVEPERAAAPDHRAEADRLHRERGAKDLVDAAEDWARHHEAQAHVSESKAFFARRVRAEADMMRALRERGKSDREIAEWHEQQYPDEGPFHGRVHDEQGRRLERVGRPAEREAERLADEASKARARGDTAQAERLIDEAWALHQAGELGVGSQGRSWRVASASAEKGKAQVEPVRQKAAEPAPARRSEPPKPQPKPEVKRSGRPREHAAVDTVHGYRKPREGEVYVGRRGSQAETPFGNWVAASKRAPSGVRKAADAATAIAHWHAQMRHDEGFLKRGGELVGKRLVYPSRTKDLSHADVLGHWADRVGRIPAKERTVERLRDAFDKAYYDDWRGRRVERPKAEPPSAASGLAGAKGWHVLSGTPDRSRVEKVIITGDRGTYTSTAEIQAWANELFDALGPGRGRTFVHGDAKGVDRIVGAEAKRRGWKVEAHPAPWDELEGKPAREIGETSTGHRFWKRAGPVRNRRMRELHKPDGRTLVVAMHGDLGESRGTLDMTKGAVAEGYPVLLRTREGSSVPDVGAKRTFAPGDADKADPLTLAKERRRLEHGAARAPALRSRPGRATSEGELPAAVHKRDLSPQEMAHLHEFQSTRKGAQKGKPELKWETKALEAHARELLDSGQDAGRLNMALLALEERRVVAGAARRPGEKPAKVAKVKEQKGPTGGAVQFVQDARDELGVPDEAAASAKTEDLHKFFDARAKKLNGTIQALAGEEHKEHGWGSQLEGDAGVQHQLQALKALAELIRAVDAGDDRLAGELARDVVEEISADAHVRQMRRAAAVDPGAPDNPRILDPGSPQVNPKAVGPMFEQLEALRKAGGPGVTYKGAVLKPEEGGVRRDFYGGGRDSSFEIPRKERIPSETLRVGVPGRSQPGQAKPVAGEHPRGRAREDQPFSKAGADEEVQPEPIPGKRVKGQGEMGTPVDDEAQMWWEEEQAERIANVKLRLEEALREGDPGEIAGVRAVMAELRAREHPTPAGAQIAAAIADRLAHEHRNRPPREPAAPIPKSERTKRMEEAGDLAPVRSKRQTGAVARVDAMRRDFRKAANAGQLALATFKHRNVIRARYGEAVLRALAKEVGQKMSDESGWVDFSARPRWTRPDELRRAIDKVLGPPRHAADHADLYAHIADATEKAFDKEAEVPLEQWWSPYFRRDVGETVKRGMRLTSKSPVHEGGAFHFVPRRDVEGLAAEKSSGQHFTGRSALYEDMGAADVRDSLLRQARARGQALLSNAMTGFSYHGHIVKAGDVDLAKLERETGLGWTMVKAKRRDQPGELTHTLPEDVNASDMFEEPTRGDMVWVLPKATVDVWAGAVRRPGTLVQTGQWITRQFVRAVLPFAATWHAGNFADQQLRLLAMGPGAVTQGSAMYKALVARLEEGDLPPGLQSEILGFALGHYGTWSSVPRPRLAEIFAGKRYLGSVGAAATKAVARHGHAGWEPRFFAKALGKPADLLLHLGGKLEHAPISRQLGAHAVEQYRQMFGDVSDFQTMAHQLVENWQRHPQLIEDFQRQVLQTAGDWAKSGKLEEALAAGPFPFWKWMRNALTWTLWTVPTKHPNAVTAAWLMSSLTREQRAKLGLEYWHTPQELYRMGMPKPQLPGTVVIGGKSVYLGSFFSPSEAGAFVDDPAKWAADKAFPWLQGPIAAAMTGDRYFADSDVANPKRSIWDARAARKDIELVQKTLQSQGGGPVFILKGSTPYRYKVLRYENGKPVIYEVEGRRKVWRKERYNHQLLGHDPVRGLIQGVTQFLPFQRDLREQNIFWGTQGRWAITKRKPLGSFINPLPSRPNRSTEPGDLAAVGRHGQLVQGRGSGGGWSRAEEIRYSDRNSPFRQRAKKAFDYHQAEVRDAKRAARRGRIRYQRGLRKIKAGRRRYVREAKHRAVDYQAPAPQWHVRADGTWGFKGIPTVKQALAPIPRKQRTAAQMREAATRYRVGRRRAHAQGKPTKAEAQQLDSYATSIKRKQEKIVKARKRSQHIAQQSAQWGAADNWWLTRYHWRPEGTKNYEPHLAELARQVRSLKRRRAKIKRRIRHERDLSLTGSR